MKKLKASLILLLLVSLTSAAYAIGEHNNHGGYKCEYKHSFSLMPDGSLKDVFTQGLLRADVDKRDTLYIDRETGRAMGRSPGVFYGKPFRNAVEFDVVEKGGDGNWFKAVWSTKSSTGEVVTILVKDDYDFVEFPFFYSSSAKTKIYTGTCSRI